MLSWNVQGNLLPNLPTIHSPLAPRWNWHRHVHRFYCIILIFANKHTCTFKCSSTWLASPHPPRKAMLEGLRTAAASGQRLVSPRPKGRESAHALCPAPRGRAGFEREAGTKSTRPSLGESGDHATGGWHWGCQGPAGVDSLVIRLRHPRGRRAPPLFLVMIHSFPGGAHPRSRLGARLQGGWCVISLKGCPQDSEIRRGCGDMAVGSRLPRPVPAQSHGSGVLAGWDGASQWRCVAKGGGENRPRVGRAEATQTHCSAGFGWSSTHAGKEKGSLNPRPRLAGFSRWRLRPARLPKEREKGPRTRGEGLCV